MDVDDEDSHSAPGPSDLPIPPLSAWDMARVSSPNVPISNTSSSSSYHHAASPFGTPVTGLPPSFVQPPQHSSAKLILSELVHAQIKPYVMSMWESMESKLSELELMITQTPSTSAPSSNLMPLITGLQSRVGAAEASVALNQTNLLSQLASSNRNLSDKISSLRRKLTDDLATEREDSRALFESVETLQSNLVEQISNTTAQAQAFEAKVQKEFDTLKQTVDEIF